MMDISSETFPKNVSKALADGQLQYAMTETGPRFIQKRAKARDGLPEFDALRDQARDIKDHVLEHLDIYLERYEAKVKEAGGHVHWADTADEARAAILCLSPLGIGAQRRSPKAKGRDEGWSNATLLREPVEVVSSTMDSLRLMAGIGSRGGAETRRWGDC